jgi:hypothetical protein
MGSSKQTTTQVNKIPEWMERAGEDLFYEAKGNATPFEAYDPSSTTDKYMNPYTDKVLKDSVGELIRANKIGKQDIASKAIGAGAFGGSRHGVAESESDRAMYDKIGQVANQINAQAYESADRTAQSEHLRGQNYNLDQASQLAGVLSGTPRTETSKTTAPGPSLLSQVVGTAATAAGAYMSDERLKEDRTPADGEAVLGAFETMPAEDYSYKPEAQAAFGVPEQRTGVMAQDYAREFPEGSDGSQIDMADMLGKMLAAIQALDKRTKKMAA